MRLTRIRAESRSPTVRRAAQALIVRIVRVRQASAAGTPTYRTTARPPEPRISCFCASPARRLRATVWALMRHHRFCGPSPGIALVCLPFDAARGALAVAPRRGHHRQRPRRESRTTRTRPHRERRGSRGAYPTVGALLRGSRRRHGQRLVFRQPHRMLHVSDAAGHCVDGRLLRRLSRVACRTPASSPSRASPQHPSFDFPAAERRGIEARLLPSTASLRRRSPRPIGAARGHSRRSSSATAAAVARPTTTA